MKYNRLGRTGLLVSRVSMGMMSFGSPRWQPWVLPGSEAPSFVRQAIDLGINLFDTADFYSHGESESALGQALADLGCRQRVVIASKVGLPMSRQPGNGGLSKKHILASLDASLKRLRTDYLDLYQLHRFDPDTPIDETLEALEIAVRSGRVLHVGASNFSTAKLAPLALAHRWSPVPRLASMQIQYNLAYREEERDMLPLCTDLGVGVMVYSPLARGLLARRREAVGTAREVQRMQSDRKAQELYGADSDGAVVAALQAVAAAREVAPAQVALAWLHERPGVDTVLCGALESRHLTDAVQALELQLSADELRSLEAPYIAKPVKDDAFSAVQASSSSLAAVATEKQ